MHAADNEGIRYTGSVKMGKTTNALTTYNDGDKADFQVRLRQTDWFLYTLNIIVTITIAVLV